MAFERGNIGPPGTKAGGANESARSFAQIISSKNFENSMRQQILYMKEVNKSKPELWKEMRKNTESLIEFGNLGGMSFVMGGTINAIKTRIETSVTGAFAPVINEINQLVSDVIDEAGLVDALKRAGEQLGDFIQGLKDMSVTNIAGEEKSIWDLIMDGIGNGIRIFLNQIGFGLLEMLNDIGKWWTDVFSATGLPGGVAMFDVPGMPGFAGGGTTASGYTEQDLIDELQGAREGF